MMLTAHADNPIDALSNSLFHLYAEHDEGDYGAYLQARQILIVARQQVYVSARAERKTA
jgi:hypothetical protein